MRDLNNFNLCISYLIDVLLECNYADYAIMHLAMGRLKMRDWNYRHHQKCRGGKCRTGIIGTILQGVENAGPSSYGKPKHLRDWKCRSYFLLDLSNYLSEFTMQRMLLC